MNYEGYPEAAIVVNESLVARFLLILQRGFMIKTRVGRSIQEFLRKEMSLPDDTIERIQSVFLDGRPVDDLGSALMRDGSTLALSAAMPGLVGATMRRGGKYSLFRGSITYREGGVACEAEEGMVRLKLFNLLLDELGPVFLRKGVLVAPSDLAEFLGGQSADFWHGCRFVALNGVPVEPESLKDAGLLAGHELVFLTVMASSEHT